MPTYVKEPRPKNLDYGAVLSYPDIEHLDGIPWFEAPLPPRLHRCFAQTVGWIGFSCYERCACGSIRRGGDRWWLERNSSRKHKSTKPVPDTPYMERKQAEIEQQDAWSDRLREMREGRFPVGE